MEVSEPLGNAKGFDGRVWEGTSHLADRPVSCTTMMINILNLPNWTVHDMTETEHDYLISASYNIEPNICQKCGSIDAKLYRYGRNEHRFMDLPIHGKRVGIAVQRQRYRCEECGGTFFQPLPAIHETRNCTWRLVLYIEKEALRRTFVDLAEAVGLDEKTIRNIFRAYLGETEGKYVFDTPEWLGIDELHLLGKHRCVLTNIKSNSLLDMLEARTKPVVIRRLTRLIGRDKVKLVAMDMWNPYKEAVMAVLPGAVIVIDKFHVVRMANICLDTVRKDLRESLTAKERLGLKRDRYLLLKRAADLKAKDMLLLNTWIGNFPTLNTAYALKEEFFGIWDAATDRKEAEQRYGEWKARVPTEMEPQFKPLITAMTNWRTEIFAYFDHRITNAYTEAINGIARVVNRNGRGYSFEVIRAKMLFGSGAQIERKPKYMAREEPGHLGLYTLPEPELLHLGTPISTLTKAYVSRFFKRSSTVKSE